MSLNVTCYLECSVNDSGPERIDGTSFCDCVSKLFATAATALGYEDPLAGLECLREIADHKDFDECPDAGEVIRIEASSTDGMMDTVRIAFVMEGHETPDSPAANPPGWDKIEV